MKEVLDCSNCELAASPGTMCGVVASRTVREMVKIGYEVSSDTREANEIVRQQAVTNPDVRSLAEFECNMRLMQEENTRRGYQPLTY